MKAVILGAGKGTRMGDLSNDTPKVLIPVCGRPLFSYVLDSLRDAGFSDIGVVVGYKREKLEGFCADYMKKNPSVNLTTIVQEKQLGTGNATWCARKFVDGEPFLSVNGDNLYSPADLKSMWEMNGNCIAAIKSEHPERYGVIESKNGKLLRLVEKPLKPKTNLINAAAYVFTPEIFDAIWKIAKSERGEYEITDAISLLARDKEFSVYEIKDYWVDFGRPEDIEKVENFLRERKIC